MPLPVVLSSDSGLLTFTPTTFREIHRIQKKEEFLEDRIEASPLLLGLEDSRGNLSGPYAAFRQKHAENPSGTAIRPDIIFLTASGHVVVVEVKVDGNAELRGREVVAQLVEYAGSLALYTEEELVELLDKSLPPGSRLSAILEKHLPDCKDPEEVAASALERIRNAELHLVIACDKAPQGLADLVRSVTAQRALGGYQLRVCEVVPHVVEGHPEHGILLVPGRRIETQLIGRTVVEVKGAPGGAPVSVSITIPSADAVDENLAEVSSGSPRTPHPEILAAVEAYMSMAEPGTQPVGNGPSYRFICVDGWPGSLHYEFIHWTSKEALGVELHFESEKVRPVADAIRDAKLAPTPDLPGLAWDQTWSKGRGRLRVVFPDKTSPDVLAKTMVALIRKTRGIVEKVLPT